MLLNLKCQKIQNSHTRLVKKLFSTANHKIDQLSRIHLTIKRYMYKMKHLSITRRRSIVMMSVMILKVVDCRVSHIVWKLRKFALIKIPWNQRIYCQVNYSATCFHEFFSSSGESKSMDFQTVSHKVIFKQKSTNIVVSNVLSYFFSSYVIDLHSTLESMIEAWHVGHDLPLIRFIGPQKICKLFINQLQIF